MSDLRHRPPEGDLPAGGPFCGRCGDPVTDAAGHPDCRAALRLEPPRFCPDCRRRMVVQVLPSGWTARCSVHGAPVGELAGAPSASCANTPNPQVTALQDFDAAHLWHPYAPSGASRPAPRPVVESASGVRLRLAGLGEVIDGMSSWWAAIHGYRQPDLDAALVAQTARMSHVMFGGLTHQPAVELGRRLLQIAPAGLDQVFLCDSGSVSVEVAVKLCLQYRRARAHPAAAERPRMLTVRGGYHGDTFTAMSLSDPETGMHVMFDRVLAEQVFAPRPPAGFDRPDDDPDVLAWADAVETAAAGHAAQLAGVIVEPVLQGAGGMHVYSPACLRVLRRLADRHDVPLVFDEIATGFGRTGRMFAAEHAGVEPDLMCVGKALTGGYLSLAAVLCRGSIAAAVDGGPAGVLMHGPTFMANPLACAVAAASLDLLAEGRWEADVAGIEAGLRAGLAGLIGVGGVRDVRVLGAVGVVQLDRPVDVPRATAVAVRHGVWLRPFRDLIYTMPPYPCSPEEVAMITAAITAAVLDQAGGGPERGPHQAGPRPG